MASSLKKVATVPSSRGLPINQPLGGGAVSDSSAGEAPANIRVWREADAEDASGQTAGPRASAAPQTPVAGYFRWKGILDCVAAAILLVPGIPIIIAVAALVRLTSRGKSIYAQERVGKDGRTFTMYKIRTMVCDAESHCGAVWTQPGDPRITSLGRALRRLHLDEFPQLVNVLKGDMSLIGPRPERPEFVEILAQEIDGYCDRLLVRPGITGLAQINLPPDTDLESVRRKLVLDLEYIQHASMAVDVRMFLCTLVRLCGLPGQWAMKLFRLQREVDSPIWAAQGGDRGEDGREREIVFAVNGHLATANGNGKAATNGRSGGHAADRREARRLPRRPR